MLYELTRFKTIYMATNISSLLPKLWETYRRVILKKDLGAPGANLRIWFDHRCWVEQARVGKTRVGFVRIQYFEPVLERFLKYWAVGLTQTLLSWTLTALSKYSSHLTRSPSPRISICWWLAIGMVWTLAHSLCEFIHGPCPFSPRFSHIQYTAQRSSNQIDFGTKAHFNGYYKLTILH
jgi:hypothetical protein